MVIVSVYWLVVGCWLLVVGIVGGVVVVVESGMFVVNMLCWGDESCIVIGVGLWGSGRCGGSLFE